LNLLIGGFRFLGRKRLGAGPGMFGDVEEHAFRAIELDLEAAGEIVRPLHVMLAAERLELSGGSLDVLDEDAEMVQPGIIEALADLIGLEFEDRQIDRPVT
jgi:hypothetical protein